MLSKENRIKNLEYGEKKIENRLFSFKNRILFFLFSIFFSLSANSQCAMCRASLESEGNVAKSQAVNDGIVYLMAIPYLLFVVVAFVVYKMYSKRKESN